MVSKGKRTHNCVIDKKLLGSAEECTHSRPDLFYQRSVVIFYFIHSFFHKNLFYKNIEAEICESLRMF